MIAVGQAFLLRERESELLAGPYLTIAQEHSGWTVIDLSDGHWTWMAECELSDEWLNPDKISYYMLHERLF